MIKVFGCSSICEGTDDNTSPEVFPAGDCVVTDSGSGCFGVLFHICREFSCERAFESEFCHFWQSPHS